MRPVFALVLLVAGSAASARAQGEPLRFKVAAGQPLTYSVEQSTTIRETTVEGGAAVAAGTATKLSLTRRWTPTAVTPSGEATLELTLLWR